MTVLDSNTNGLKVPLIPMGDSEKKTEEIYRFSTSEQHLVDFDDYEGYGIDKYMCKTVNRTSGYGFLVGILLQFFSLYIVAGRYVFDHDGAKPSSGKSIRDVFTIYQYWVIIALALTTLATILIQRYHPKSNRRATSSNEQAAFTMRNLELFFECFLFQIGILLGSAFLISIVSFASMSHYFPVSLLLTSFCICFGVSFLLLSLLQICVYQTCSNVSSVHIILRYDTEEEDAEDEEDFE